MSVRINTNVDALMAQTNLAKVGLDFSSAVAKLSSGLRINSAADDAAGLAISEKLTTQVNGFDQGGRNAQDAISMIQTGEGALSTTHSMLQRMRQLAVQASNDSYTSSDRANIQSEINQLIQEVDRIAQQTDFNTKKLLDGSAGGAQVTGGGPDVKAISAQANVALTGTFGIVAAQGANVNGGAGLNQTTFQTIESGGGNPATTTLGQNSTLTIAAGDGTSYTFAVDASGVKGNNMTVTGVGGRGNGYTTTVTNNTGITINDFVTAVNAISGTPLSAFQNPGANVFITDRVGGIASAANPGAPQQLTTSNVTGGFNNTAGTAQLNLQAVGGFTGGTSDRPNMTAAGQFTNGAALGVTAANAQVVTSVATRSAVESGAISSGSFFTTTSSLTITGGLGQQTFTAQAGESLETFFQNVNGSGIGVTMSVDQNSGKILLYNNNYGNKNELAAAGNAMGLATGSVINSTGVNSVSVTSATGDFGSASLTGLNIGFDSTANLAANPTLAGSVNGALKFSGGVANAAVNAKVTFVDPGNIGSFATLGAGTNGGYTTIAAQGLNSDTVNGTTGLSGTVVTLQNPGNINADSWTVKQNAVLNFQVGANANQTVGLNIDAATSQVLGVTSLDVLTTQDAETAITQLDRAIQSVSSTRANMGAVINRLTNSMTNDMSASNNAAAANSRIRDVDVARQTVDFTRDQILLQAGTAVLAQANQAPTSILSLLR